MMTEPTANSIEVKEDLGTDARAVACRWKLEIKLADKRESAWRKKAMEIYRQYTPDTPVANSFNVLWTNTETLRQSVYNSVPQPDVRRRYSDEDPLGKAVGEILTRALEFSQDTYDFDGLLQKDVLSMLLPGRAVSRVRYVPDIASIGGEDSPQDDDTQESEAYEEIQWEQVVCERVQWDDFRILCPAKTWDEVCAVGYRHRLTRDDLIDKFGKEVGNKIKLDDADDEDVKSSQVKELFQTATVWEVWDKDEKQVVWINDSLPEPAKTQDDPLKLGGFFDCPRPLYAIENDQTLIPAALYSQYEQQAKELNRVSARINKLIDGLKVRGIYDATITELSNLTKASDYELVPAQNVTALLERGGLEKAIWMMPIETAAAVLKELYVQRDATKQVIYEITGISDIMRAATDPNETFGAQKMKSQWGTQRLQRLQREVQRYARDLIRLKAEVIAEKFQQETLQKMTLVDLPTDAQVQQQYMQAAQQAQMQGQPPPPMPQMITWERAVAAMRDDATRTYRVDIETDSTLEATQDSDMEGLQKVLGAMAQLVQGFGPAVQAGAIPMEAVKAIMSMVARRSKMGTAVEDAMQKMQQPAPAPDPHAGQMQIEQMKMQHASQLAQMHQQTEAAKLQQEAQMEQMKAQMQDQLHQREMAQKAQADQLAAQNTMAMEQHKQEMQARQIHEQNQLEAQRDIQKSQLQAEVDTRESQAKAAMESQRLDFEREKAMLDYRKAIEVAEIGAKASLDAQQARAATQASKGEAVTGSATARDDELHSKLDDLMVKLSKPRKIVRGPDGKIAGVE